MNENIDQKAFDAAMNMLSEMFEQYTGYIVKITGKVSGKDHWAYALIPPQHWPAFQSAQAKGGYDLAEYASEILAHGKGKTPPADTLEKIKTSRPDIDFSFENQVLQEL